MNEELYIQIWEQNKLIADLQKKNYELERLLIDIESQL